MEMNRSKFPAKDAYPLFTPIDIYLQGLDIIEKHREKFKSYIGEPDSAEFQEFRFWHRNLIIWGCCTIEAFVNLEGVSSLGTEFYKNTIERLNIIQKIRIIYAIQNKEKISTDVETFKKIKQLFDYRHKIIHPKTRSLAYIKNPISPDKLWTAKKVKKIISSIFKIIGRD